MTTPVPESLDVVRGITSDQLAVAQHAGDVTPTDSNDGKENGDNPSLPSAVSFATGTDLRSRTGGPSTSPAAAMPGA
jgi:hypothetical protein